MVYVIYQERQYDSDQQKVLRVGIGAYYECGDIKQYTDWNDEAYAGQIQFSDLIEI
jgi:hypothetical protein